MTFRNYALAKAGVILVKLRLTVRRWQNDYSRLGPLTFENSRSTHAVQVHELPDDRAEDYQFHRKNQLMPDPLRPPMWGLSQSNSRFQPLFLESSLDFITPLFTSLENANAFIAKSKINCSIISLTTKDEIFNFIEKPSNQPAMFWRFGFDAASSTEMTGIYYDHTEIRLLFGE